MNKIRKMTRQLLMGCEDRFFAKYALDESTGCHLWQGGFTQDGYGVFHVGGLHTTAHRVAYVLATGESLDNRDIILHHCPHGDNPRCINPDHLAKGTRSDNALDAVAKGRCSNRRKLDDLQAVSLRMAWAAGESTSSLCTRYGIGSRSFRQIVRGRSYKNLPVYERSTLLDPVLRGEQHPLAKLTAGQVLEIRGRLREGASPSSLARAFHVSGSTIQKIRDGQTWKHLEDIELEVAA